MSSKNETPVLILSLFITIALLGAGFWWFSGRSGFNLGRILQSNPPSNSDTSANSGTPPSPANPPTSTEQTGVAEFVQVQNVPSGLFSYGGSTTWAPIRLAVDSAIQVARPEFRLRYVDPVGSSPSSDAGIRMLLDGQVAFAQSSRSIRDQEYDRARQRGFSLSQIAVAIDGIAVAVNPNLTISGLTLAQLKSIYSGQVTNWQQVGGPDLPIKPYSRPVGSGGTADLFIETVLGGQRFGATVQQVSTTTQALRQLSNSPGGIYFASAPEVVPQCTVKPLPIGQQATDLIPPYQEPFIELSQCPNRRNQLNHEAFQKGRYPLTRNLFVVVKQNGQIEQRAGDAYANFLLSQQGQDLLTKAGFVRIR